MTLSCAILAGLLLTSCSKDDAPAEDKSQGTVNLIIDTDLGNCTDDLFALQAAFAYRAKGACKILGVMQDCGEEKCHRLADALMHYYKADDIPL